MTDNLVQLLPDAIANQIAAGEVIQRPASVVKELVENAVDSGADQIQLIIKDAGKTLIQVIDNGCGMSETDARMSLERHATSKLRTADDLFSLRTMGFRGEALASIVAIAQLEMRTRRAPDDLGTRILVEGTEVKEQEPVAAPPGTSMSVRNLFYNVPARRNFLKSDTVELRHIRDEFIRIALAHPEIGFDLHVNDKLDLRLPSGRLRQRIVGVFGKKYGEHIVRIEEETDILTIKGFVGKPEAARKRKVAQFFFVNDRYIRSSYLHHAVTAAYDQLLGKDAHPFYVIFLEIDPARIDVNVHPTKQEIKFEDERLIYNYLKATIRHGLGRASIMPTIDFETNNPFSPSRTSVRAPAVIDEGDPLPSKMNAGSERPGSNEDADNDGVDEGQTLSSSMNHPVRPSGGGSGRSSSRSSPPEQPPSEARRQANNLRNWEMIYQGLGGASGGGTPVNFGDEEMDEGGETLQSSLNSPPSPPATAPPQSEAGETLPSRLGGQTDAPSTYDRAPYQLHQRYIVSPLRTGWLLIDQQAAHERILYEGFLANLRDKPAVTQQSLFPQTLELPHGEAEMVTEILPQLRQLGFDLEPFGGSSFIVRGVPAELAEQHGERELLEQLVRQYTNELDLESDGHKRLAASLARSGAIRRGEPLDTNEMRSLIDRLFACTRPELAPGGRRRCFVRDELPAVERRFEV